MMNSDGVADGIGRTISPDFGIFEGQIVNGVPLGWGNVIDNRLHHYEGWLKSLPDGSITCTRTGTYYVGAKTITGKCTDG